MSLICIVAALVLFSGCGFLYGISELLFCSESDVRFTTQIKVQDGHFGMQMWWPRGMDELTIMMLRSDRETSKRIGALHYDTAMEGDPERYLSKRPGAGADTSEPAILGILKLYRKGKLLRQTALYPRRYAVGWPDYFGIGSTGYNKFRVDSLEILNASPLLDGLTADFVEYHRCMCLRESGPGPIGRLALADAPPPEGGAAIPTIGPAARSSRSAGKRR